MKKKVKEKRLAIKMLLCLVYLIVITILSVCSYLLYEEKEKVISWDEVESVDDYTYMNISKMSEKFAYYSDTNVGIHFVIEKEDTGLWHTYLIAINEDEYDTYKDIIDYTYERTEKVPTPIRIYGYPVIIEEDMKALAIKNISNFVPAENEIKITEENYETYLTNSYLDTTKEKKNDFSMILCLSLLLLFIVIILLIMTILDKDKIVDNVNEKLDKEFKKTKKLFKKKV